MSDELPSDAELEAQLDAAMNVFIAEQIEHECRRDEAIEVFNSDLLARLMRELVEQDLWPLVVRAMPDDLAVALHEFAVALARMPSSGLIH